MQFGICAAIDKSDIVKANGWDFIEEFVQNLLQGQLPDNQWEGAQRASNSKLPIPAANGLVPGTINICGPDVDPAALQMYITKVIERAKAVGIKTLVFGSGAARNVPEGFDRKQAFEQIVRFLKGAAPIAQENGITIVIEPLNTKECNIITTVAEAMTYVKALNHPNVKCLVDSYHFWLENEPLENLRAAMPWITHVHIADPAGRVAPGESGSAMAPQYDAFFKVLKEGKYSGLISVECLWPQDISLVAGRIREFVRETWDAA